MVRTARSILQAASPTSMYVCILKQHEGRKSDSAEPLVGVSARINSYLAVCVLYILYL
jgi:hypothetical protein